MYAQYSHNSFISERVRYSWKSMKVKQWDNVYRMRCDCTHSRFCKPLKFGRCIINNLTYIELFDRYRIIERVNSIFHSQNIYIHIYIYIYINIYINIYILIITDQCIWTNKVV